MADADGGSAAAAPLAAPEPWYTQFQLPRATHAKMLSEWHARGWPLSLLLRDHFSAKVLHDNKIFVLIERYGHTFRWTDESGLVVRCKKQRPVGGGAPDAAVGADDASASASSAAAKEERPTGPDKARLQAGHGGASFLRGSVDEAAQQETFVLWNELLPTIAANVAVVRPGEEAPSGGGGSRSVSRSSSSASLGASGDVAAAASRPTDDLDALLSGAAGAGALAAEAQQRQQQQALSASGDPEAPDDAAGDEADDREAAAREEESLPRFILNAEAVAYGPEWGFELLPASRVFQFSREEFQSQMGMWVERGWPIQMLLRDHYGAKVCFDNQIFPLMEFYGHKWSWSDETGLSIPFKAHAGEKEARMRPWSQIVETVRIQRTAQGWLLFDGWNYLQDGLVPVHLWQWRELTPSYRYPEDARPEISYIDIISFSWEHEGMQGFGVQTPHGHTAVEFGDDLGNMYSVGVYMDPRSLVDTKAKLAATLRAAFMSPDPYMPSKGEKTVHRVSLGAGPAGRARCAQLKRHIESIQGWRQDPDTGIVSTCRNARYNTFSRNCGDWAQDMERYAIDSLGGHLVKIEDGTPLAPHRTFLPKSVHGVWWRDFAEAMWNRILLLMVDLLILCVVSTPWLSNKIGVGYDDTLGDEVDEIDDITAAIAADDASSSSDDGADGSSSVGSLRRRRRRDAAAVAAGGDTSNSDSESDVDSELEDLAVTGFAALADDPAAGAPAAASASAAAAAAATASSTSSASPASATPATDKKDAGGAGASQLGRARGILKSAVRAYSPKGVSFPRKLRGDQLYSARLRDFSVRLISR